MSRFARFNSPARCGRIAGLLVVLTCVVFTATASAQDVSPEQMLEDFVHYTKIAKPDLAEAFARRLLGTNLTNAEFAIMVDDGNAKRFDEAMGRALLIPALEPIAAELGRRVEAGRLDLARDTDRINEAIEMLTGTQRQQMLATQRLKAAGEYAAPGLLRVITDQADERRKLAAENMLREIGLPVVTPLGEALSSLDPVSQRIVADILGDIGYPHVAPYLKAVALDDRTPGTVVDAANRAFAKVGGVEGPCSDLFGDLAGAYFVGEGALVRYPFEDTNNVWSFDPYVGLVPTPVPTAIYSEVMTMTQASRALAYDPAHRKSLGLFVASNLKRENDLPEGSSDPIYGEAPYTPDFYATVFGTEIGMDVLELALRRVDTPLIRDAIASLQETTGGSNLFSSRIGQGSPLLNALSYPDRRVQYEAALTLARALPNEKFDGDYRIVPLLASAVRTSGQSFAVVVADDDENRRQAMSDLETLNFTVAAAEPNTLGLEGRLADLIGVDLVVVRMGTPSRAKETVMSLKGFTKTSAAPMLVLAPAVDAPQLQLDLRPLLNVKVARPGLGTEAFSASVDHLLAEAAGGRMTEAVAEAYAFDALGALEDIAISCSPAYDIGDAQEALLAALETRTGRARLLVAGILSRIGTPRSQETLFDAAFAATGGERIDLLNQVAESVKRYGNLVEPRHIAELLDLVANSSGSTAEAAARVHGALSLPSNEAVRLITEGHDSTAASSTP